MTRPGLCGRCRHARTVVSRRGSTFYLCGRSRDDPRFPRYPVLPVLACTGFASGPGEDEVPRSGPGSGRDATGAADRG